MPANLPSGPEAYSVIAAEPIPAPTVYQIAPTDVLALKVFGEPEVSIEQLRVDDAGNVQVPLIGQLQAAGHTVVELRDEITTRLQRRYLRNPQVNVLVSEAAKRYVSVEGEVKKPGVYEIDTNFTLLSAIARAESPTQTARLSEVIIFRTIDGKRMAGRFNLKDIRGGAAPDPQIMNGDVVMVGYSTSRGVWQDLLKAAPAFNAFAYILTR
ncbi:polysaccharide biosynthesis/export family protein [Novosphingobium sp. fls2-241-R2A-195]|uniref:polysaccharide biosynthesis/export family protein n=1 Tax=Novosphingobium sp. fls2-241-R2A-195 TaxID=3040296 RepID=UPI00254E8A0D|nr:polysaccharide biosynthesis/export family protein [Novosphingobium sp. fls2-241-R2A-195]